MQEMSETRFQSLGGKDPLEEEMATHSSILAWRMPWTENPGRLQSLGPQRVGHGNPLQHSCLENALDGESWRTTAPGAAKSRTRLCD